MWLAIIGGVGQRCCAGGPTDVRRGSSQGLGQRLLKPPQPFVCFQHRRGYLAGRWGLEKTLSKWRCGHAAALGQRKSVAHMPTAAAEKQILQVAIQD